MSGQRRRGPMGGHGPGMRPTEKAKDFKGSMGKLFRYMSRKGDAESCIKKDKNQRI